MVAKRSTITIFKYKYYNNTMGRKKGKGHMPQFCENEPAVSAIVLFGNSNHTRLYAMSSDIDTFVNRPGEYVNA